jgi:hypothetical protein
VGLGIKNFFSRTKKPAKNPNYNLTAPEKIAQG